MQHHWSIQSCSSSSLGHVRSHLCGANTSTSSTFGSTSTSIHVICRKESEPSLWPPPFLVIFNLSLQLFTFPTCLKSSNIVPKCWQKTNKHHLRKHFKRILLKPVVHLQGEPLFNEEMHYGEVQNLTQRCSRNNLILNISKTKRGQITGGPGRLNTLLSAYTGRR